MTSRADSAGRPASAELEAADNVLACVHVLSSRISGAFYPEVEARYDITLAEWRVILTLVQRRSATAIEIASLWAMDKMAISRAVRRLDRMGRVRRAVNPDDRRSHTLTLTAKGRRLYERILPAANARYHDITASLTRRELDAFRRTLSKLLQRTAALAE